MIAFNVWVFLLLGVPLMISMLSFAYNFSNALRRTRYNWYLLCFFGPVIFLLPWLFSEEGNVYRKRALLSLTTTTIIGIVFWSVVLNVPSNRGRSTNDAPSAEARRAVGAQRAKVGVQRIRDFRNTYVEDRDFNW